MSAPIAPRLPQLDGLRGLAALGVAFGFHAQSMVLQVPGDPLLGWFRLSGWSLVDLFFLISGYVFAHVYLPGGALMHRRGLADFAIARVARLYPLHLAMLLVTAIMHFGKGPNDLEAFVAHLLLLQTFVAPIGQTFDGPSWSISVEMVCYLLFGLAAFAGRRILPWLAPLVILGCALALASELAPIWDLSGRLARGLLGYFTGVALWQHRSLLARIPSLALLAALPAGLYAQSVGLHAILPLTMLAWPAALLLALRGRLLGREPFVWLGDRSYAIYLIHMPAIEIIVRFGRAGGLPDSLSTIPAIFALMAIATLALSDIAYRRLELPARRFLRARLSPSKRAQPNGRIGSLPSQLRVCSQKAVKPASMPSVAGISSTKPGAPAPPSK